MGLMLTEKGPYVVEYNARFGDPETQALMPILKSNLLDLLMSAANGDLGSVKSSFMISMPVVWFLLARDIRKRMKKG